MLLWLRNTIYKLQEVFFYKPKYYFIASRTSFPEILKKSIVSENIPQIRAIMSVHAIGISALANILLMLIMQKKNSTIQIVLECCTPHQKEQLYCYVICNNNHSLYTVIFNRLPIITLQDLFDKIQSLPILQSKPNQEKFLSYTIKLLHRYLKKNRLPRDNVLKIIFEQSDSNDTDTLYKAFFLTENKNSKENTLQLLEQYINLPRSTLIRDVHKTLVQYYFVEKIYKSALFHMQKGQINCNEIKDEILKRIKQSILDSLDHTLPDPAYLKICFQHTEPKFIKYICYAFLNQELFKNNFLNLLDALAVEDSLEEILTESPNNINQFLIEYYLTNQNLTKAFHYFTNLSKLEQAIMLQKIKQSIIESLQDKTLPCTCYLKTCLYHMPVVFIKTYFHALLQGRHRAQVLDFLKKQTTSLSDLIKNKSNELLSEYYFGKQNIKQALEYILQCTSGDVGLPSYKKMITTCYLHSKDSSISIGDENLPEGIDELLNSSKKLTITAVEQEFQKSQKTLVRKETKFGRREWD